MTDHAAGPKRPIKAAPPGAGYLDLKQLADYSQLSIRTLRNFLALPPGLALPCYRPGSHKVLVRKDEFDAWFAQFRQRGRPHLVRALRDLGLARIEDPS